MSHGLPDALERGLVTMADIDGAVRRVLTLKERLGLFDDPYRRVVAAAAARRDTSPSRLRWPARRRAARSCCCKNDKRVLPLAATTKPHRR